MGGFCVVFSWQEHRTISNKKTVYRKQTEQLGFNQSLTLCFPIKGSNESSSIVWKETQRLPNNQTRLATFHSRGTITIALVEFRMLNYNGPQAVCSAITNLFEYGPSSSTTGKKVPMKWSRETRTPCINNNPWRIKLKSALATSVGILHKTFLLKSTHSHPNQYRFLSALGKYDCDGINRLCRAIIDGNLVSFR